MSSTEEFLHQPPQVFVAMLKEKGIRRFHFVYDDQTSVLTASHPELQAIADFIRDDKRDFFNHEGLFFQLSQHHDTLQGAFVHRTVRGAGAGGVRYWHYETLEAYLRDGLRLSKGMTRKNALAGLWWGGGKGVMAHNPAIDKFDPAVRRQLYRDYGRLISAIAGCYVTAEDAGTNVADMANVFATTRFTTCIPPELGGSGNPSVPTARGVVCGIEAALFFKTMGSLAGKKVAIQGIGNVGGSLIGYLFEKDVAAIIATDISSELVDQRLDEFRDQNFHASAIDFGDNSILAEECDILCPCATGAVLNAETIPTIRATIICGAANNQLADSESDDLLLYQKGITYVPDFLTNRMGIVNCANEQYGYVDNDDFFERHLKKDWQHSIYQSALRVLQQSKQNQQPPAAVAIKLADELSKQPHPVFGHRGKQIIQSLVAKNWYLQKLQSGEAIRERNIP